MEVALEAGADDVREVDGHFEVTTSPADLTAVQKACEAHDLKPTSILVQMVPQNTIPLDGDNAAKMLKLMEALDDHEDVQNVHSNFDMDDAVMEKLAS